MTVASRNNLIEVSSKLVDDPNKLVKVSIRLVEDPSKLVEISIRLVDDSNKLVEVSYIYQTGRGRVLTTWLRYLSNC